MNTGETFFVTTGEYSDYGIHAILRARRDFSWDELAARWSELGKDHYHFVEYLTDEGYVEHVKMIEIHMADYSRMNTDAEKKARYR